MHGSVGGQNDPHGVAGQQPAEPAFPLGGGAPGGEGVGDETALHRQEAPGVAAYGPDLLVGQGQLHGAPAPAAAVQGPRLSSRERRDLAELPERIQAAEDSLAAVDTRLADSALYREDGAVSEVAKLTEERARLQSELELLFQEWQRLEEIADGSNT